MDRTQGCALGYHIAPLQGDEFMSSDSVAGKRDREQSMSSVALDADYEAAMASIHQAIENFRGCTLEERASLQRDLDQLHSMADKLAAGKVEIVVFGEISTGKSALINALVGEAVAEG